jgi:hypothetical protein
MTMYLKTVWVLSVSPSEAIWTMKIHVCTMLRLFVENVQDLLNPMFLFETKLDENRRLLRCEVDCPVSLCLTTARPILFNQHICIITYINILQKNLV